LFSRYSGEYGTITRFVTLTSATFCLCIFYALGLIVFKRKSATHHPTLPADNDW